MRPPFAYHRPATLEEACRLLAADPRATALAGGTDLMVHLRQPWRGKAPSAVVSLRRIPGLAGIEATDQALRLGAGVTLSQLIDHPLIQREYPVLPLAARYMGSPAVRNLATVGGNLCNASPAADLPPVLLALDAQVVVSDGWRSPSSSTAPGRRRSVPASSWPGSPSRGSTPEGQPGGQKDG